MDRRTFRCALAIAPTTAGAGRAAVGQPAPVPAVTRLQPVLDRAEALTPLQTVTGSILAKGGYRGRSTEGATNTQPASKAIISAPGGIAPDRRVLQGAGFA